MYVTPGVWGLFWTLVVAMLAIDLTLGRGRVAKLRSAAFWSAAWIAVSVAFGVWIGLRFGRGAAMQFFAAYLLEKSLSIDNVFVFALIFSATRIPPEYQHRVLLWGVVGALVMRGVIIAAGVYLIERFHWIIYPFAVILLIAALRQLFGKKKERVERSCAVCTTWVARIMPVVRDFDGGRFVTRRDGRLVATPLLVSLVMVETTDLIFALDSIPAALGITREPFLVYSSNILAMLGLRSLYFLLVGALHRLRYLREGLAIVLSFVAIKMLLDGIVPIGVGTSIVIIGTVLLAVTAASLLLPPASRGTPP